MTLSQIHIGLANACVIFSLVLGLYSLWRFFRKQGVGANLFSILAAAELLYLAQAVVGFVQVFQGARPGRGVHYLYGILLVIVLPGTFAYLRGKDDRRAALIYGLVGLFLAGVSLRAIGTAGA